MKIVKVKENDFNILREMAKKCKPLDVHTPYTYWVVCRYFSDGCFFLYDNDKLVGSIITVTNNNCLLIWQIGIIEEYRRKGYSYFLYEAVVEYAKSKGLEKINLSIDPDNKNSYYAIHKFCGKQGLTIYENGKVDIKIPDESFYEFENIYQIDLK